MEIWCVGDVCNYKIVTIKSANHVLIFVVSFVFENLLTM